MAFDVGERLLERVFPKMRKTLLVILGLIIFGGYIFFGEDRIRYRLTYEFDTPQGALSGSHVVEATRGIGGVVGRYSSSLRGEAAVIDFGGGRVVVALLVMSPHGDINGLKWLPMRVFSADLNGSDQWDASLPIDDPKETRWIPTLVAFADKANPASAQIVFPSDAFEASGQLRSEGADAAAIPPDRLSSIFDGAYRFRRATITIVPAGYWPFSRYPLWPRQLFGEPLTTGLEQALPRWRQPEFLQALRSSVGSPVGRELAFKW